MQEAAGDDVIGSFRPALDQDFGGIIHNPDFFDSLHWIFFIVPFDAQSRHDREASSKFQAISHESLQNRP